MEIHSIIGYLAAFFLISTLLPQLYHSFKTKKVDDLSYYFICLQVITCSLFLIYGILLKELPLILANLFVLLKTFVLLSIKIIYRNKNINKDAL